MPRGAFEKARKEERQGLSVNESTSIEDIIEELEQRAKLVTPLPWSLGDGRREQEFDINAPENLAFAIAAANAAPALCGAVKLLRNAFTEACEMCDREAASRELAEKLLVGMVTTLVQDMKALGLVLVSAPDTPLALAKKYLEERKAPPGTPTLNKVTLTPASKE